MCNKNFLLRKVAHNSYSILMSPVISLHHCIRLKKGNGWHIHSHSHSQIPSYKYLAFTHTILVKWHLIRTFELETRFLHILMLLLMLLLAVTATCCYYDYVLALVACTSICLLASQHNHILWWNWTEQKNEKKKKIINWNCTYDVPALFPLLVIFVLTNE